MLAPGREAAHPGSRQTACTARSCSRGFTLPEALLAMALGSMVMLSAAQVYPPLRQQSQTLLRQYRLEQLLQQAVSTMEKDLRRAGFCQGMCKGRSWMTGQAAGEMNSSCVIVAYDLNGNGRWEAAGEREAEYFGYRLRQGALEGQRGVTQCQGVGWERLLDPQEVTLSRLAITRIPAPQGGAGIHIHLVAHWSQQPEVMRELRRGFAAPNL